MEDVENNQLLQKYSDFSINILPIFNPILKQQDYYHELVDKVNFIDLKV